MAVDQQLANAWERLTEGQVVTRWIVPDPATEPWGWVEALTGAGYVVAFDEAQVAISRPELGLLYEADVAEGDALEAALEVAIKGWANGSRDALRA